MLKFKLGDDPWPGFIKPQLPKLVTTAPFEGDWLHEIKFDGYRIMGHIQMGIGHFYTRNGLDWSHHFPHLLNALEKILVHDAIFDGEIVALDDQGRSHFHLLQNFFKSKQDKSLRYFIFDLLYLNGIDLRELPLIERKERLHEVLARAPSGIEFSQHVTEEGDKFFEVTCEHQLEGIISKLADAPYQSGRGDLWVKIKCSMRQEFVIGGWTELKGVNTGLGALLLGVQDEHGIRYVGKVGTGFDRKERVSLQKKLARLEVRRSPFLSLSQEFKNVRWVKPQLICEVNFSNWTDKGILRSAVFLGLRFDKTPMEITREDKGFKLIKEVSSPDKVLFEIDHRTKKDVAHYYQFVAPVMLQYMKNRPLSFVRCPSGAKDQCFYQKHFTGQIPKSFSVIKIKEKGGEGNFISIHSVEGLLELVQLNAFELHTWNTNIKNYHRPDQIVMDLDPGPEVSWGEVVDAAYDLKGLLLDLELDSFVKVTGGKGLHLHIPIAPLYDWDQIKAFSQGLALQLTSMNPKLYTTKMSKKIRVHKIFIDYLRNGFGATAVAPYSLRAKNKSAVALPLEWKELKMIKSSDLFTMEKALHKIKTRPRDPWEDMLGLEQKIQILRAAKSYKKVA